jgi:hypothetical protein
MSSLSTDPLAGIDFDLMSEGEKEDARHAALRAHAAKGAAKITQEASDLAWPADDKTPRWRCHVVFYTPGGKQKVDRAFPPTIVTAADAETARMRYWKVAGIARQGEEAETIVAPYDPDAVPAAKTEESADDGLPHEGLPAGVRPMY